MFAFQFSAYNSLKNTLIVLKFMLELFLMLENKEKVLICFRKTAMTVTKLFDTATKQKRILRISSLYNSFL